jgi:hypothetical protein
MAKMPSEAPAAVRPDKSYPVAQVAAPAVVHTVRYEPTRAASSAAYSCRPNPVYWLRSDVASVSKSRFTPSALRLRTAPTMLLTRRVR